MCYTAMTMDDVVVRYQMAYKTRCYIAMTMDDVVV